MKTKEIKLMIETLEGLKRSLDMQCRLLSDEQESLLERLKEQLNLSGANQQRELFYNFITWYNAKPNKNKEKMIYTDTIEEYLKL